jgi:hypothetical protein
MYGLDEPSFFQIPSSTAALEWSAAIGSAMGHKTGAPVSESSALHTSRRRLRRLGHILGAILAVVGVSQIIFNYLLAGLFFALLFAPADLALLAGSYGIWRHFEGLASFLTPKR